MVHQEEYWTELSTALVDKVIDNQYQLLESLGHGAYGCLFLGQSIKDNSYVAVKVLSKSEEQQHFQQIEIDIQSSLKHPHILSLHHVIQDKDFIYMIMELCDAGDLFDFVINDQEQFEIRQEHTVKKMFIQILNAVEYMHKQGIYHRDLKLENILLQQQSDDLICKVADFGLATRERYSQEFGCGSTSYLAPEHFYNDDIPYDAAASDTWSLAILLIALMFGRNPWQEASSQDPAFNEFKRQPFMLKDQLFPDLSVDTFLLLKSALAINENDRISVSEFKKQFLAINHLYDDYQEQSNVIHIPTSVADKKQDIHSFDSAFFSNGNAMSWSDMVEEDEAYNNNNNNDRNCRSPLCNSYESIQEEDEDDPMFVHHDEKESWWL